jgi:hypothetical protein
MEFEFTGKMWFWRGPAPYFFVTVPAEESQGLQVIAGEVTYGWGMIPVKARIGKSEWKTSLWPKDGGYIVPIKAKVQRDEELAEGDEVTVWLEVRRER